MSAVAIIPARGQSRRIPRKNIRPFHGKPIIAYSIETAKASGLFDKIVVSSEDAEILRVGKECGATPLIRDESLTVESVGTQQITAAVLQYYAADKPKMASRVWDYACCIYPCAPLLRAADLQQAYRIAQDYPFNYVYAKGQFYFGIAQRFIEAPDDFSYSLRMEDPHFIDIDTESDWQRAEQMYAVLHKVAA